MKQRNIQYVKFPRRYKFRFFPSSLSLAGQLYRMTAYEGSKNDEIEISKTKLLRPKTNPTKNRDQDHIVSYLLGGMLKTTAFRVKKSKRDEGKLGRLGFLVLG